MTRSPISGRITRPRVLHAYSSSCGNAPISRMALQENFRAVYSTYLSNLGRSAYIYRHEQKREVCNVSGGSVPSELAIDQFALYEVGCQIYVV